MQIKLFYSFRDSIRSSFSFNCRW